VRDFFLKGNGLNRLNAHLGNNFPGLSHEQLKLCCQAYANIGTLKYIPHEPRNLHQLQKVFKVSKQFPFLEYVASNILYNAEAADGYGISQHSFLANFALRDWIELANLTKEYRMECHTSNASLIYILAEQNLPNLICIELESYQTIDIQGELYGFPSHAALANRNEVALRALLRPGIRHWPYSGEIVKEVSRLLEGHWNSINFLLRNGIEISSYKHQNLLAWAARKGHTEIVRLLLETGKVDVNSRDEDGRTPLLWAAQGHETIFRLLLETKKVDINWKDNFGRAALSYAASGGHEGIVKL